MAASILIADDDAVHAAWSKTWCRNAAMRPSSSIPATPPSPLLTAPDAPVIDAMVLDLVMPGLDGMGVLAKIREAGLNIPVIVQTAHGGIDNVVSAMRAGAQDFVVKPVGIERLQVSLRNALNASALKGELQRIKHSREGRLTFADIITRSEAMAGVLRTAQKAAASTIPVLIEGESGVGKELFARAIHGSGERKGEAVRRRQLRRDPRQSRGIDPVRPREGRLHRRHRTPHRQIRRSLRRHAVSRRSRRIAAGGAGETAARAAGRRGRSGRRAQAGEGRRPHHFRDQPQIARPRQKRAVSAKTCSIACTCCR